MRMAELESKGKPTTSRVKVCQGSLVGGIVVSVLEKITLTLVFLFMRLVA